ncbi:hypothetical protein JEQ12_011861, partial [Ovis aries]
SEISELGRENVDGSHYTLHGKVCTQHTGCSLELLMLQCVSERKTLRYGISVDQIPPKCLHLFKTQAVRFHYLHLDFGTESDSPTNEEKINPGPQGARQSPPSSDMPHLAPAVCERFCELFEITQVKLCYNLSLVYQKVFLSHHDKIFPKRISTEYIQPDLGRQDTEKKN